MARRSDHTREELYDMALQAARLIVEEEGLEQLSTRRIAKEIGYSVGTLYNLFANRDELILHLNAQTLQALEQHFVDVIQQATTQPYTPQAMATLLDAYLGFIQKHTRRWRVLIEFSLPEQVPLPDWYSSQVEKVLQQVESQMPDLPHTDKRRAVSVLWSGLHGILTLHGSGKLDAVSQEPVANIAHHFVATYLKGLTQAI
ncbi:TetR/AcrR family transcriptional regulator [Magnetococcus sp. PR-3]|uniref:TetR/AcrR family transcriptional regulator n=1 Tax=Magnetococcus sp. PR-3 TaxID=3120355 RepID=UPI002FCDE79F